MRVTLPGNGVNEARLAQSKCLLGRQWKNRQIGICRPCAARHTVENEQFNWYPHPGLHFFRGMEPDGYSEPDKGHQVLQDKGLISDFSNRRSRRDHNEYEDAPRDESTLVKGSLYNW